MQRNRLVMKARRDRAEAITDKLFDLCARTIQRDNRPTETVDDFLRRGGKITVLPPHEERR